jgi:hypothetical protein
VRDYNHRLGVSWASCLLHEALLAVTVRVLHGVELVKERRLLVLSGTSVAGGVLALADVLAEALAGGASVGTSQAGASGGAGLTVTSVGAGETGASVGTGQASAGVRASEAGASLTVASLAVIAVKGTLTLSDKAGASAASVRGAGKAGTSLAVTSVGAGKTGAGVG